MVGENRSRKFSVTFFAWPGFLATFALRRWLESPRIVRKADYGPLWRGHWVLVATDADLDEQLVGWLQEAYNTVGLQEDLRTGSLGSLPVRRGQWRVVTTARFGRPIALDRRYSRPVWSMRR